MQFSEAEISNWRAYERVRRLGKFNMFDPRARSMTGMSSDEWVFCMKHYAALREQANAIS